MIDQVRAYCRELLADHRVVAVLGIKEERGRCAPHVFSRAEELDRLSISSKYPLMTTCRPAKDNLLKLLQLKYPGERMAVVARGCDERALFELSKRKQVQLDLLEIVGYSCDAGQAEICQCPTPYPTRNRKFGEKTDAPPDDPRLVEYRAMNPEQRRLFWAKQLDKCIKCYGCRNFCPVCICKDCLMEQKGIIGTGWLPVEFPTFHFIQRYHHAAQCIECGECEFSCPMDIPLRLMSKALLEEVKKTYKYEPGLDPAQESPLVLIGE